jgi:hypothetical protein
LNSCNNTTEPSGINNLDYDVPVVPGLILTSEESPDPIGIWRNPHLPNWDNETSYYLSTPYPNPANGSIRLYYALGIHAKVSLWLVRAKLPEDDYSNFRNSFGGVFVASNYKIVLLKDEPVRPGIYEYIFDWTDEDGKSLPAGFYRVYYEADGHLFWCDVLLARTISDLPPDLRGIVLWEN